MLRTTGGFITLISALLCIGVITLWIRSRHHADVILIQTPSSRVMGVAGYHGGVLFAQSDLAFTGSVSSFNSVWPVAFIVAEPERLAPIHDTIFDKPSLKTSLIGFKVAAGTASLSTNINPKFSAIMLPAWFLTAIFAILPLGIGKSIWVRSRRKRRGLCLGCGYDMRASEGKCPECGREVAAIKT